MISKNRKIQVWSETKLLILLFQNDALLSSNDSTGTASLMNTIHNFRHQYVKIGFGSRHSCTIITILSGKHKACLNSALLP